MRIKQLAAMPESLSAVLRNVGHDLARRRLARNQTQTKIAERAGVSRNTISRIENGDPGIAIGQIVRYLAALGDVDVLRRAFSAEHDPATRMLNARERTRRARALSPKELQRYDF